MPLRIDTSYIIHIEYIALNSSLGILLFHEPPQYPLVSNSYWNKNQTKDSLHSVYIMAIFWGKSLGFCPEKRSPHKMV